MDTRTLFHKISQRMLLDFDASGAVKHAGSKGTIRENNLRNFLGERLPHRYGLGAGEVIGRVRNTSRQCDVIIYDNLHAVTLIYDESIKVFPIDCVYGVIEVKSALSKDELLDALEKVKVFKSLGSGGTVHQPMGGGMTMAYRRQAPFASIFAYGLAKNSLESLWNNLKEWEANNEPQHWPNYICVLGVGTICHQNRSMQNCIESDKITAECWPLALDFGDDSLFHFFSAVHDVCAQTHLGPVELARYYDPPVRVGRRVVDGPGKTFIRNGDGKTITLNQEAIDRIVSWCSDNGTQTYGETMIKRYGSIPVGMENTPHLNSVVYFYNPDNLLGLHEVDDPLIRTETGIHCAPGVIYAVELTIDEQLYIVATNGFKEADFEEVQDPS